MNSLKIAKDFILKKKKIFILIIALLVPFIADFLIYNTVDFSKGFFIRTFCIYGIYVLILAYKVMNKFSAIIKKMVDFIMKYRYVIAGIILIIGVLFKVNFSSLNMWYSFLGEPEQDNILIGEARAIRSDEWITQSSFMLGQASTDNRMIHNPNISNGNNNMYFISAPVNDILEIARPLLWGFFFGKEIGFSFYFVLKMIAVIMVSIELIRKITKGNNLLSLVGGIVLGLAPAMMWWFSTAVVDIYIYGAATIVLFGLYMNNLNFSMWKKILIAIGIIISICGFAISLYPAVQVPFAFVILVFVINDFAQNRKNLRKKDYIIMSISLMAIVALVTRFIAISIEDIKLMMGTVYPGERLETGGTETISEFVGYLANLFFPYSQVFGNTCEASTYIYPFFGSLILIVMFFKNYRDEKDDGYCKLIVALIALYAIFLFWELIGFNKIFSKITFLYFSPARRTHIISGMLGVILSIVLLKKMSNKQTFTKKQGIIISLAIVLFANVILRNSTYAAQMKPIYYEICLSALFFITYFLIMGKVKQWSYTMVIIAIFAGAYVNPIMIGIKPVTDTDIANQIRSIAMQDEQAVWISDGSLTGQYIIANGVKCLNGVNVYPNFSWLNKVDPEKKYNQIYNRFAHIGITLSNETKFELIAGDCYVAYLTYENVKDIGVKYYFTKTKVDENIEKEFNLTEKYINDEKSQYIYEIK